MKTILKGGGKDMGSIPIRLMKYTCERCNHSWIPRSEEYPRTCPKCRSPYWDKPKKSDDPSEEN